MHRSLQTSQYLQTELGLNPEIWMELHEVKGCREQNKAFPGLKRSEIERNFPGYVIPEDCTEEGWFLRETAESEEEGWERAGRVWERLRTMANMEKYQGKSIIIITHGLFLDYLAGRICGRAMKGGKI
jgi:broad specificity phosphatase PhoE